MKQQIANIKLTNPSLTVLPHSIRSILIRLRSRRLNIEMHVTSIIILSALRITRAPSRRAVVVVTCICDHDYDVGTAVRAAVVRVRAGCSEGVAGAAALGMRLAVVPFSRRSFGEVYGMNLAKGRGRDGGMDERRSGYLPGHSRVGLVD